MRGSDIMISSYVREQKRYTRKDLCGILRCSPEEVVPVIRKLKEFGLLKAVRTSPAQKDMSELLDKDIEVADVDVEDDKNYLYVFTFVGVIIVAGRVLKCYPKYLLHNDAPKVELRQILKVLEKYGSQEQIVRMFNETSEKSSFNVLALLLFLLNDYHENGLYRNAEEIVESNGSGEILWDTTINETFALLSGGRPYYVDLRTKKRIDDDFDYFKRLHECILTKATRELRDADLLELFEIEGIELSDEDIGDFGEKDYVLYRLESEMNVQFNTRKQLVLKTLHEYISHSGSLYDSDALSVVGTNSFNLVWEKVCAEILDNQLNTRLGLLKLPVPLKAGYNRTLKLKEIIEKPFWSAAQRTAEDTLIPDMITIRGDRFFIFDAKYYNAKLESGESPEDQPGIESVTKQYLYQLAYGRFIKDHDFRGVVNCFLMPTDNPGAADKGVVSMDILNNLGLESISVRMLPASYAYECYLAGKTVDVSQLGL